jgi:hypothetical protein
LCCHAADGGTGVALNVHRNRDEQETKSAGVGGVVETETRGARSQGRRAGAVVDDGWDSERGQRCGDKEHTHYGEKKSAA